jgi:hypothetical protein
MCFAMISGFKITMAVFCLLSAAFFEVDSQLCDDNPLANKGMKITSQASSSCLKGQTTGMLEIASCHDTSSHDIQFNCYLSLSSFCTAPTMGAAASLSAPTLTSPSAVNQVLLLGLARKILHSQQYS